jgi:dolichyl-phosphate-mannose-protein mannosyltransferase
MKCFSRAKVRQSAEMFCACSRKSVAEIHYYDIITMRHKDTKVFLHSHPEKYPLRYDDGRISSQGQQVNGYGHNDTNNWWQVIPTKALPETGRGRIVRGSDVVQLLHVNTDTLLLTHDVASPLMPTNQEFTTWQKDDYSRHNDTLFRIVLTTGEEGDVFKSKSGQFRLIHVPTRVAMWTHPKQLPEWGFRQQEINGNKNSNEKTAVWYIEEIVSSACTYPSPPALCERLTDTSPLQPTIRTGSPKHSLQAPARRRR